MAAVRRLGLRAVGADGEDLVLAGQTGDAVAADLRLALALADAADEITTRRFRALDLRSERKPDRTPVTDADRAVEELIRTSLAEHRPADVFVGEESGESGAERASTDRVWIVDPIDGTKNFLRGVPAWATLIALVVDGTPAVGVVSAPRLRRRWWAARGLGAWAATAEEPPERLRVSTVSQLEDAYLSTTHLGTWVEYASRDAYLALADACWENRAFGDFWQHCLVAEGAIDLAAEPVVNAWDVAALQVLVEEAGGRFSDLRGTRTHEGGDALSSNGPLHDAALRVLGG